MYVRDMSNTLLSCRKPSDVNIQFLKSWPSALSSTEDALKTRDCIGRPLSPCSFILSFSPFFARLIWVRASEMTAGPSSRRSGKNTR